MLGGTTAPQYTEVSLETTKRLAVLRNPNVIWLRKGAITPEDQADLAQFGARSLIGESLMRQDDKYGYAKICLIRSRDTRSHG